MIRLTKRQIKQIWPQLSFKGKVLLLLEKSGLDHFWWNIQRKVFRIMRLPFILKRKYKVLAHYWPALQDQYQGDFAPILEMFQAALQYQLKHYQNKNNHWDTKENRQKRVKIIKTMIDALKRIMQDNYGRPTKVQCKYTPVIQDGIITAYRANFITKKYSFAKQCEAEEQLQKKDIELFAKTFTQSITSLWD